MIKSTIKKLAVASSLMMFSTISFAQVGINTLLPDSSSVLDLSGVDNQTRGLLIPRVDPTNSNAKEMVNTPRANGLLVFDSLNSEFYFWLEKKDAWYSLNRWQAADSANVIFTTADDVGIGTDDPSAKLDVNGNVKVTGIVKVAGAVSVTGDIGGTGNLDVAGKVKEGGFDLIPAGIVVMWSGSEADVPDG